MAVSVSKAQRVRILLTWASVTVGFFALAALCVSGTFIVYGRMYENKMFPGVRVIGVRLDGLTREESRKAVQDAVDTALGKGLQFRYHGQEIVVDVSTISTDPDASRDLIQYDIGTAIDAAYGMGRGDGWERDGLERLRMRVVPLNVDVKTTIDGTGIDDAIRTSFSKQLHPAQDAHVVINASSTPPIITVREEQKGIELILDPVLARVTAQAAQLSFTPIELSDRVVTPKITKQDLGSVMKDVEAWLQRPNLVFTYQDKRFPVATSTLAGWISVTGTKDDLSVTLDPQTFSDGLRASAPGVEQEGKNGSLVVKDGKVESFMAGTDGVAIDTDAMLRTVLSDWPASNTFPLVVKVVDASLVGEDPERMGIKELIGVGHSNFAGSPSNRRKNIAHGAAQVSGTIIQPGETFSLIKTLGPIDGAHKWLSELVIKGNVTKPEFGGGLCQIGTTVFRAAMDSGLPIVERQNHSYRVVYYEPAGTDATIYDPKPDLRFLNDTGNPIFINAYIKGDEATFEFWGTRDGRTAEVGPSKIYNVTSPPPVKLVETLDLKPGQKKCTESAHKGADVDVSYTVTMADGTIKDTNFHSHYRPWQAVCLVGVTKLTDPTAASGDTLGSPDIPVVPTSTR